MALVKNLNRFGKKPASGRITSSTKSTAAKKTKAGAKLSSNSHSKSGRSQAKFSTLKSRQMALENAKRSIWAALQRITDSLIIGATSGNLATAKELFHFAGVYSLPMSEDESAAAPEPVKSAEEPASANGPATVHPIDEFFTRIGIPPSNLPPEAEVA